MKLHWVKKEWQARSHFLEEFIDKDAKTASGSAKYKITHIEFQQLSSAVENQEMMCTCPFSVPPDGTLFN